MSRRKLQKFPVRRFRIPADLAEFVVEKHAEERTAPKNFRKSERKALHSIAKKPLRRAADAVEAAERAQVPRLDAVAER